MHTCPHTHPHRSASVYTHAYTHVYTATQRTHIYVWNIQKDTPSHAPGSWDISYSVDDLRPQTSAHTALAEAKPPGSSSPASPGPLLWLQEYWRTNSPTHSPGLQALGTHGEVVSQNPWPWRGRNHLSDSWVLGKRLLGWFPSQWDLRYSLCLMLKLHCLLLVAIGSQAGLPISESGGTPRNKTEQEEMASKRKWKNKQTNKKLQAGKEWKEDKNSRWTIRPTLKTWWRMKILNK